MRPEECSVLMISLDPALLGDGIGNALERHREYAKRVKSLSIVVLGGSKPGTAVTEGHLTIVTTGIKGFRNIFRAYRIGKKIILSEGVQCIVTQDPHATGLIGYLLKRKTGVPLIVHFHGDFWKNTYWRKENWRHGIFSFLQTVIIPRVDHIRAVSYGIADKLVASGVSRDRISVISTPVNDTIFGLFDDKQKILVEELRYKYQGRDILLFVGRLVAAKNLQFIVRCAAELKKTQPKALLLIIGDGEERVGLEKTVRDQKADSHIRFLGSLPHKELPVYYHLATLLLLLSTNESFGKVIIEAGLCGCPAVSSQTAGAEHIIEDGKTGIIVPINDFESTVAVLDEVLSYPEDTKRLGVFARDEYRKRFSSQQTISDIVSMWAKVARR